MSKGLEAQALAAGIRFIGDGDRLRIVFDYQINRETKTFEVPFECFDSADCGDNEFCNDRDPTNDIFTCKPKKENGPTSFCANDDVCLSGHCSATKDCEALPSLGKPCATNDNCAPSEVCIGIVDRKCQPPSDVGGPCGDEDDCKNGQYCTLDGRECAAKEPKGSKCVRDSSCESNECKWTFKCA